MITDDPTVIPQVLSTLQRGFGTHKTKDLKYRKTQLENLIKGVNEMTQEFHHALKLDLGASEFHSEIFSIKCSVLDIKHTLQQFQQWAKIRKVDTSMLIGPGSSYIQPEPFGVALVLSAWNYPVYTALPPVAQAISAGNCVILKPSEIAPHSSNVLKKLFQKYLDPECYQVIEGGAQVAQAITTYPFDLIIFTGSPQKGKLVAKAAAENLVPCILELGGKSPTLVDQDANIENAALRIAQGRFLNAGQTCVACDYVLCHSSKMIEFTARLKEKVKEFYGSDAKQSEAYCRIVNQFHTKRIQDMIQENHGGKIEWGGQADISQKYIEPTIVSNPRLDSQMMTEEIFGPILPIVTYNTIEEAIDFINKRPKPLALYYFGYKNKDKLLNETSSGAFSQNDAIFHVSNSDLPFGGVQNSGLGSYHGIHGFNSCSHLKPVFIKHALNIFPYNARYPPYSNTRKRILGTFFDYFTFSQARFGKVMTFLIASGFGYKFYRMGKFDPFIENMKPYISSTFQKMSKL